MIHDVLMQCFWSLLEGSRKTYSLSAFFLGQNLMIWVVAKIYSLRAKTESRLVDNAMIDLSLEGVKVC